MNQNPATYCQMTYWPIIMLKYKFKKTLFEVQLSYLYIGNRPIVIGIES